MRLGRRLAFDFGRTRIGVAASDLHGILASPHPVLINDEATLKSAVMKLIAELEPIEIYVGLPINLQGAETASTMAAVDFAKLVHDLSVAPVRLVDERFTTSVAQAALKSAGKSSRSSKSIIDSATAAVILEQAIEAERRGSVAGKLFEEHQRG